MVARPRDKYGTYCPPPGDGFQYSETSGATISTPTTRHFQEKGCREPYQSQKTDREPGRVVAADRIACPGGYHSLDTTQKESAYPIQLAQQTRPEMVARTSATKKKPQSTKAHLRASFHSRKESPNKSRREERDASMSQ